MSRVRVPRIRIPGVNVRASSIVIALVASLAVSALPACEGFLSSSKMAQGQRYQSGDQSYDPYFESVHQTQVSAAAWPDEKKAARRPLVNALALTPTASDDTLVSATRERIRKQGGGGAKLDLASAHVTPSGTNDGPLYAAVEETVRLELDRARKLKSQSDKLEEMAKHGQTLKESADKEFSNRGAEKADEKKTEKSREIRRELGGAIDACRDLSHDAAKQSRDAQDFLEDLGAALEAKDAPPKSRAGREAKPLPPAPPKVEEKKPEEKPEEKPSKLSKPSKPAPAAAKPKPAPAPATEKPAPAEKPAAPEKPAPKPPTPPPDEVFNP